MKNNIVIKSGTLLLIFMIIFLLLSSGVFKAGEPQKDIPEIDPDLIASAKTSEPLDFLIYFEEQADLSKAYELPWEERGWYVYETLKAQADQSQASVRIYLDTYGVDYEPFWIQNVIAVESSDSGMLYSLLNFLEIDSLQSVPQIFIEDPLLTPPDKEVSALQIAESNLVHINADDAWSLGVMGKGTVVGSIDSGVRYTHEALSAQYRGNTGNDLFDHNYSWWDAVNGNPEAYDDHGHGSHTTGIMVGKDGNGRAIGVAPEAEWIACKAISGSGTGYGWDFLECGQFMLAPWDLEGMHSNPDLRPQVVNNSWGSCSQTYASWYEDTIDAWLAAGIYPVFSNGNAGNCGYPSPPGLNTAGNPARSYHVTAVGSTGTDNGQYAPHSNWGPTDSEDVINPAGYPWIKPQVVAPGVSILSAVASNDSAYAYWGGTSMSAPHVTGLVSLMWEAGTCLLGNYLTTETLIQDSATTIPFDTGNGDEGPGNVPNHATGWGEIDVLAAVSAAQAYCQEEGSNITISGKVLDGSGQGFPLYAQIQLESGSHQIQTFTNPFNGTYQVTVSTKNAYDLSITSMAAGYQTYHETGIIFTGYDFERADVLMVESACNAPGYVLSDGVCQAIPGGILAGFVTDAITDLPINGASIRSDYSSTVSAATPQDSNLADGFYQAFQPLNTDLQTIRIRTSKSYYLAEDSEVLLSRGEITRYDPRLESIWHRLTGWIQEIITAIAKFLHL